ncbi:hypothetical protein Ae201684P_017050 [Aphanomyces euteiches]|uniref:PH domain-containing protein n=1 Tax=Aphanomyces euteiches TaxID=100861 RepID=A0A6G0WMX8_9STRA|nr:hypothetical protein Ae201684_013665 [Aphanomyces euteiches]KAH9094443.1 hypothetical protein Ae201684P_017050 [Aphanomyces euteiches]
MRQRSLSSSTASLCPRLVRQHGYLMKKSLFRGLKPHYFSLLAESSKLYSFADFNDFHLWHQHGQPTLPVARKLCFAPRAVYQVVAVDQDRSSQWKLLLSVQSKNQNVNQLTLVAESSDEYFDWVAAFHDALCIQTASACDTKTRTMLMDDDRRRSNCITSPRPLQRPSTYKSTPRQKGSRNIVLIGAANGSTVHVSDGKLAKAKEELKQLLQEPGTLQPYRGLDQNDEQTKIEWLHGHPDFTLTDLAYLKGRTRWHDGHSLAARVETALRVFVMEVAHKPRVDQWHSIVHHTFTYQVNDEEPIEYHDMASVRHTSLGLIAVPAERLDEVSGVFTSGFPFEVTAVFTASSSIYFAYRQWGAFTGSFDGHKGNGETIEVSGFGHMLLDMDLDKMHSLRLFCEPEDLFESLSRQQ